MLGEASRTYSCLLLPYTPFVEHGIFIVFDVAMVSSLVRARYSNAGTRVPVFRSESLREIADRFNRYSVHRIPVIRSKYSYGRMEVHD